MKLLLLIKSYFFMNLILITFYLLIIEFQYLQII